MPNLKPGESKTDYISRCVKEVMKEGATQEQALGKCYGMYNNFKKKSVACIEIDNNDEILVNIKTENN